MDQEQPSVSTEDGRANPYATIGTKMLAFYGRGQNSGETNSGYLEELASLAREAALPSREIVGRFIAGTRDARLRTGILNMGEMPSLEELRQMCNFRGFDLLFRRNQDCVLEMIFLSLDYNSFKKCFQVCRQWRDFLQSQSFRRKSDPLFYSDLWMDESNLEKKVWNMKRDVRTWATNGREVAFIERLERKLWLSHISETGQVKSILLKIASRYQGVSHLWILDHIILIGLDAHHQLLPSGNDEDGLVCAVYKENMEESVLFPRPPGCLMWRSKFHPKMGAFFAACFRSPDYPITANWYHSPGVLWLHQVSVQHHREEEWDAGIGGNCVLYDMNCCKSNKLLTFPRLSERFVVFNTDCTRLLFFNGGKELICFAIGSGDVTQSWVEDPTQYNIENLLIHQTVANSQFIVLETREYSEVGAKTELHIQRLHDFSKVGIIGIEDENFRIGPIITERLLFTISRDNRVLFIDFDRITREALFNQATDGGSPGEAQSHMMEYLDPRTDEGDETIERSNIGKFIREDKMLALFSSRQRLVFPTPDCPEVEFHRILSFKNLSIKASELIMNRNNETVCIERPEGKQLYRFLEIVEGVGVYEEEYLGTDVKAIGTVSWKSKKLPRAVMVWLELISHPRSCNFCHKLRQSALNIQ